MKINYLCVARTEKIRIGILFFLLISTLFNGFSAPTIEDTINQRRTSFKLYSNFFYEIKEISNYYYLSKYTEAYTEKNFLWNFTPALRIEGRNGNNHEFELKSFSFKIDENKTVYLYDTVNGSIVISDTKVTTHDFSIGYEYDYVFLKKKDSKIKPYIGASAIIYYSINIRKFQIITNSYPTNYKKLGEIFSLAPGINWAVAERIYLNLNISVEILDFYLQRNHTDNPFLPEKNRTTTLYDANYFPRKISVRFGIGFKL